VVFVTIPPGIRAVSTTHNLYIVSKIILSLQPSTWHTVNLRL
jgi:hypothetical protein